jgi:hypothetical protein
LFAAAASQISSAIDAAQSVTDPPPLPHAQAISCDELAEL